MASSTRGKRSAAAAAAAATQETGTPAKVARVGGAEPAVKDKAKKKGESDNLSSAAPFRWDTAQAHRCLPPAFAITSRICPIHFYQLD